MKAGWGLVLGGAVLLAGCTQQSEQQRVRQEARNDARELRKDLQQAGAEAQKAAEQFRADTHAAVAGARDGWKEGSPAPNTVDINSAPANELATLPGMSQTAAERIVHGRPYGDPSDLMTRGLLPQAEYDRVRDRLEAK
jgi:competence protein ComEA